MEDFQNYPQLLLPHSDLLEGDRELATTTDHHVEVRVMGGGVRVWLDYEGQKE